MTEAAETRREATASARHPARVAAARCAATGAEVHLPGDRRYDELRLPWNRRLDPLPGLIVCPRSTLEVRTAIAVARDQDLLLAPQATGHGTELPCDGGLLLHTSGMSRITVDPERRVASVGPGARMADVVAATRRYGLLPITGHGSVGVAGFVLGGGIGWLSRAFGLAADNLLRARLVTSDGTVRTADRKEHPDLHWALRGGGGNFGVVTSLDLRLHPVTDGYGGAAFYGAEHATGILRRYREWVRGLGEAANVGIVLFRLPSGPEVPGHLRGRPVVAVRALFLTSDEAARRSLRPFLADAGRPLLGGFRRFPVAELGAGTAPPTARCQRAELFHELPDPVVDTLVTCLEEQVVSSVEVRLWGGAIAQPVMGPGPAAHLDVRFSVLLDAPAAAAGYLNVLGDRMRPYATGGTFLNFLTDPSQTATAFTAAHHARLVELKRRYDPDNVFHLNHNIPPGPQNIASEERGIGRQHPADSHPHR